MEQIESRHVPIFHTLETIERINKHIALHQSAEQPDKMAIEQWQRIRADLQRQLRDMLFALDALPRLPDTETERPSADMPPRRRGMSVEQMIKIREDRIAKRAERLAENSTADEAPKKRGMSAEHMAKIREARIAKRTEAAAIPKPKAEESSASGALEKRGLSAEQMDKIRAARLNRRTKS